jgi:BirA family transcriptional regulator, biotin operon repressor / biotin---[acetyl-CoA-carboxylase] ligase
VTNWRIHRVATTGSTNDDLMALGVAGAASGTVVVADHQTAGRGRLDRQWEDRAGTALLVSILLRTPDPQVSTRQVAVAAARACERLGAVRVRVKWPNDLVVDDAKLAGILSQVGVVDGEIAFVVVGVGVNLQWAPDGAVALGDVSRDRLLDALLHEFDAVVATDDGGLGEYLERSATIGTTVRVSLPSETIIGRATAIDAEGRLLVATSEGVRVMTTGDVIHLRTQH